MTNTGHDTRASSPATSRFTARRLKSAFGLWRGSVRRTDLLIATIFIALSLGIGAYVYARAHAAARLEFARQAKDLHAAITTSLNDPLEDLRALQSFLQAYGSVSRRQFQLSTEPLLGRHKHVYAFEWLPVVREGERGALEGEARTAGLSSYRFWESGPDGTPRAAGRRAFYVPIHYMEPPNALALGLDIAASPDRWETAAKARDGGVPAASAPFRLIEDATRQDASAAVAVYAPVYVDRDPGSPAARRDSLYGFVSAIFRVSPLVSRAAATGGDVSSLGYVLRDQDAPGSPTLAERPQDAASLPRSAGLELAAMSILFADRHQWNLDVFALPGAFPTAKRGAIAAAMVGVFISLAGLVLHTSVRTIIRLRRQLGKVGPYRLVARLGHGAMGVVWEARHALLRRPTAIKLLAPGTGGERALARFEREVQLTAALTHPSTVAIYDYGRTGEGVFYYAMELLQGINLLQLVSFEGPLPPGRVVHLLRQACGALTEAHAAGLIHRDIKPANLMVCIYGGIPDFLKVLDFGLVKDIGTVEALPAGPSSSGSDAALSQDGSLLGTPLYMSPEGMTDPAKIDARADLFALGAVGYYLLTGSSPFPGRTAIEVFSKERQGPPRPLAQAARHPVPPALESAILACLAFRKEDRPASVEVMDALLEACDARPAWTREDAKAWWQDRGPAALEAARAERQEGGQLLVVSAPDESSDG